MIPIAKTLVRPAFIGKTHTQVGAPKLLEATQARGIVYIYYNSNNSNNDVYIYYNGHWRSPSSIQPTSMVSCIFTRTLGPPQASKRCSKNWLIKKHSMIIYVYYIETSIVKHYIVSS